MRTLGDLSFNAAIIDFGNARLFARDAAGNPRPMVPSRAADGRVQLVGKRRGDLELLEIAMALETTFSRNPDLKRPIPNLEDLE